MLASMLRRMSASSNASALINFVDIPATSLLRGAAVMHERERVKIRDLDIRTTFAPRCASIGLAPKAKIVPTQRRYQIGGSYKTSASN